MMTNHCDTRERNARDLWVAACAQRATELDTIWPKSHEPESSIMIWPMSREPQSSMILLRDDDATVLDPAIEAHAQATTISRTADLARSSDTYRAITPRFSYAYCEL